MTEFFDAIETRDPAERERALAAALPAQMGHAMARSPAAAARFAGIDPRAIDSRAALAQLPVLRKSELHALQAAQMPFAGLVTLAPGDLGRIYSSPGPVYDPEGRRPDYWRMARALFAAGFRAGQIVHNTFSYHFTPAGFMFDTGAQALGCAVIPAGVGNTELQVAAIRDVRPSGYAGTPGFLRILLEKADELGSDVSSLERALVAGEALPPSLRAVFNARGIRTLQCYGIADLGLVAYESAAQEGMICDEGVLIEIVRPGTGDPVRDGEVGEVVVTTLTPEYPLIRFATGDLSAVLPGPSPCGRTNLRIRGWMGRADQTTKVKGMFVHPAQIAEVLRRNPEIRRARLVVDFDPQKNDRMTLRCETSSAAGEGAAAAIAGTIRDVCKLRGEVAFVAPGELPNDGKVIDDTRKYE